MRLQAAPGLLLGPVSHRPRRALQGWGRDTCSVNTQEMMPSVSHTYPGPPTRTPTECMATMCTASGGTRLCLNLTAQAQRAFLTTDLIYTGGCRCAYQNLYSDQQMLLHAVPKPVMR